MTTVDQLVSGIPGYGEGTPHPSEFIRVWHPGTRSFVKLVSIKCFLCDELVDITDPRQYYLERRNGDSFYGFEAHHQLCADKAAYYVQEEL